MVSYLKTFLIKFFLTLTLLFSVVGLTISSTTTYHYQLQTSTATTDWQKRRTLPFGRRVTKQQLQQKWNELRPFFQKVKGEFPNALFINFDFSKFSKGMKNYRLHLLFANSESAKIDDWSDLAQFQLAMLTLEAIKISSLESFYTQAVQKIRTSSEKNKYFYVFALRRNILEQLITFKFPYLTVAKVGDPTFAVSAIAKKVLQGKTNAKAIEGEILAFILANVDSVKIDETLRLTPQYRKLWDKLRPRLLRAPLPEPRYLKKTNSSKGVVVEINALWNNQDQSNYFRLPPTAKSELYLLNEFAFNDVVKAFGLDQAVADESKGGFLQMGLEFIVLIAISGGFVVILIIVGIFYWLSKRKK